MAKLGDNQKSALNITACIVLVAINTCINFFLSPFIVKHLGVEANGYITLANNFVSYFGLIITALNSMAGRFILIEIRRDNLKEANEYYSSVLFGDWILASILLIPCLILVFKLERFINIPKGMLFDIKILFALVFSNMFISLLMPKWNNATYITNNFYLRSLKSAFSAIMRASVIILLYSVFPPFAFFVAVAGVVMTLVSITCEFCFKRKLLPQLRVKFSYFNIKKIKTLISSGIWNTVSSCGNILLEGLDILIANIFISPIASGIFALSKIIPNMLNQIAGSITSTFGPPLIYLYVDAKISKIKAVTSKNIKLISIIASIPIGVTIVMGSSFFKLWVPSQNENELAQLSSLALIGTLVIAMGNCINNIFIVVNKLKFNSIMVVISGLFNTTIVYLLLKTTDLGIYAIAGVSTILTIIRLFGFVAPYAARCIDEKWYTFYIPIIRGMINIIAPMIFAIIVKKIIPTSTWIGFFIAVFVTCIITLLFNGIFVLNKEERYEFLKLLHIKIKK